MLGRLTSAIGEVGGDIGAIDIVRVNRNLIVRDVVINARDDVHGREIVEHVRRLEGFRILHVSDRTFLMHMGGKIEIRSKVPVRNREELSMAYTPGVARICRAIAADRSRAYQLTIKRNTVAVVTDGSAVLGLGNIGAEAAMPVMEGKALLFKEFGGVDAFPICLATQDTDEIVRTVQVIAPGFGGINLEDIAAPRCFEVEDRLKATLDIPVFHDDQHGTAVVVLAALINALKIVRKPASQVKVVISGMGAAGIAVARILVGAGIGHVVGCDRRGAIHRGRDLEGNSAKQWIAENTNQDGFSGTLGEALEGADVFIGVSAPNLISATDVRRMARDPIVFALANPDPEILPDDVEGIVRVMATGRSDYPNQINNVLCFPGIFRGAFECQASQINERMKLAAAHAIAECITPDELTEEYIIPSVFNRRVAQRVAEAVVRAAQETGVARRHVSRASHWPLPADAHTD